MSDLQSRIQAQGEEIIRRMESQGKTSIFSKDYWYGSIMDWSMRNQNFKINMFRFVDVLPVLQSSKQVAEHLKEYFSQNGEDLPAIFNAGLGLGSLAPGLMAGAIKKNVTQMAKMFITGENPDECLSVLQKSRKNKIAFTVDILGEATLSDKEALDYQNKYLQLMQRFVAAAEKWSDIPQVDQDHQGPIPKVNVSVKMTALCAQISEKAWEESKEILKQRLRPLFLLAIEKNIFLNLDMEHYAVKNLTLEVFKELLSEPELRSYRFFGCVIQAYLKDSSTDILDLIQFAKGRKQPFTVRLVKGAYWDSETVEAVQKGWPIPVYTIKSECDANFEACTKLLLENTTYLRLALASHNVRSIAAALAHAEHLGLAKNSFEIQMLYGMADPIKKTLVEMGYRVREYAPVGELIPGMAYLVRRLLENTSNQSWLRGKFSENKSASELLQDPLQAAKIETFQPPQCVDGFKNEALLDFSLPAHRKDLQQALDQFKKALPHKVAPVIDGKTLTTDNIFKRCNPSNKIEELAHVHWATIEDAHSAIAVAKKGLHSWKSRTIESRAQLLERLADKISSSRYDFIATQVFEVGKTWSEADADVAEAIDFCRYYALQARKLLPKKNHLIPGEDSQTIYRERGVTAIIAPWNFPLAILCGMAVAALVTGNTIIVKPAEQSSLVAWQWMQTLLQVGFPADVVQFLPGPGEEVGAALVDHPDVCTIAFTGSKNVGLEILKRCSQITNQQNHFKKALLELGGKNTLIIDSDADLDEAIDAVLYSAFGFSGQKCSACSRVVVLEDIYERFCERLQEAVKSYKLGSSIEPGTDVGPVVDQESQQRILQLIDDNSKKFPVLFKSAIPNQGYFVPVTIFKDVDPLSTLAQEEIFGPVLSIIQSKDFLEALDIANNTNYALTGGIFSRSPENIQKAKEQFAVGNLYINRGITGAYVQRHPFGGFKLSGTGSKAGGVDYLKNFTEAVCITENTMRRGFTPEA